MTEPTPRDRLADELEVWSNKPSNDRDAHRVLAAAILEAVRADLGDRHTCKTGGCSRPAEWCHGCTVRGAEHRLHAVTSERDAAREELAAEQRNVVAWREQAERNAREAHAMRAVVEAAKAFRYAWVTGTWADAHTKLFAAVDAITPKASPQPSGAGGLDRLPLHWPMPEPSGAIAEGAERPMGVGADGRLWPDLRGNLRSIARALAGRSRTSVETAVAVIEQTLDACDRKGEQIASLESSLRETTENFHAAEQTVRSIAALLGWQSPPTRETLENEIRALQIRINLGEDSLREAERELSEQKARTIDAEDSTRATQRLQDTVVEQVESDLRAMRDERDAALASLRETTEKLRGAERERDEIERLSAVQCAEYSTERAKAVSDADLARRERDKAVARVAELTDLLERAWPHLNSEAGFPPGKLSRDIRISLGKAR